MSIAMNYRFQIAAVCVLFVIIFDYLRRRRISLLSTRLFMAILCTSAVNLVADFLSVFALSGNIAAGGPGARLSQQFLMGTLDLAVFFMLDYVIVTCHHQARFTLGMRLMLYAPLCLAFLGTLFGRVDYVSMDEGMYTKGSMITMPYVMLVVYVALICAAVIHYRDRLSQHSVVSMFCAMGTLLITTFLRAALPVYSVSGLGLAIAVLFLYLSFENPAEQVDSLTDCFNQRAFFEYTSEQLCKRDSIEHLTFGRVNLDSFFIVNIRLTDYNLLYNQLGRSDMGLLMNRIAAVLSGEYRRLLEDGCSCNIPDGGFASLGGTGFNLPAHMPSMNGPDIGVPDPKAVLEHSRIISELFRRIPVFRIHDNSFTMVVNCKQDILDCLFEQLQGIFSEHWLAGGIDLRLNTQIDVIECPKFASTPDEIISLLNYLSTTENISSVSGGIHLIDSALIDENTRQETLDGILKDAMENDGFEMFYQPIFNLETGRFESAEALVRLKDRETLGFVSPEEFIPLAEKKGYIRRIGAVIFEKVCRFYSEKGLQDKGIHYIEVNVSAIQGIDPSLPDMLDSIMKRYNVPPEAINLEITETAAVETGAALIDNMKRLRDIGSSFSMDDFGTGYSNLSQMSEVEYELIKLDKSLIWPCFDLQKDRDRAMRVLECVAELVHGLGYHIVAEGIETEEMVELMRSLHVKYLQGYFYSKPIAGEEFVRFLDARQ